MDVDKFEYKHLSRVDKINEAIEERIKFYKEENAKFEAIFKQCKLRPEESSSWHLDLDCDVYKEIDKICVSLEQYGVTDFDAPTLAMAYVEQKSNETDIIERLKNDTNLFLSLNDEVQKDIESLSRELNEATKEVEETFSLSTKDVYMLEKKIIAYKNELAKFEKKHSWLKDPKLNLTHIAKETQILTSMLEEKEALEKELQVYQGLQPDLQEASHQLNLVKKQYLAMKEKFHSSV